MELPTGITPEIYQRAVEFATDWRPGRRCEGTLGNDGRYVDASCHSWIPHHAHDIPLPPLTDELLLAMLRKGLEMDNCFLTKVDKLKFGAKHWCAGSLSADDRPSSCGFDQNHRDHYFSYTQSHTLDAAIILAAALMCP